MHRRTLDGKTLRFGHTGKLYKNSFIMYDKGTQSQWIHVTGECAKGKLKGKKLEFVASVVTTWGAWKKSHPKTKVLPGRPRRGFMGRYDGVSQRGHLGFHIRVGIRSKLYSFRDLEKVRIIHDSFRKVPLTVVYVAKAVAATAWDRRVDGKELTFELKTCKAGVILKDNDSESSWDPLTGVCMEGKLKGKALKPVVGIPIRLDRWRGFYPRGEVYRMKK